MRSILDPDGEHARNLEHTSNNHGSGVDKSRYRRWTLHGIGQPDVQWEHCRLAGTTDKHQHKSCWQEEAASSDSACTINSSKGSYAVKIFYITSKREVVASCVISKDKDTYEEEHIGKTCYDERLLRCVNSSMQCVIEANEEVRAYTHKLPEHIHLEDIGGKHQSEH